MTMHFTIVPGDNWPPSSDWNDFITAAAAETASWVHPSINSDISVKLHWRANGFIASNLRVSASAFTYTQLRQKLLDTQTAFPDPIKTLAYTSSLLPSSDPIVPSSGWRGGQVMQAIWNNTNFTTLFGAYNEIIFGSGNTFDITDPTGIGTSVAGGAYSAFETWNQEISEISFDRIFSQTSGVGSFAYPQDIYTYTSSGNIYTGATGGQHRYFSIDGGVTNIHDYQNTTGQNTEWCDFSDVSMYGYGQTGVIVTADQKCLMQLAVNGVPMSDKALTMAGYPRASGVAIIGPNRYSIR